MAVLCYYIQSNLVFFMTKRLQIGQLEELTREIEAYKGRKVVKFKKIVPGNQGFVLLKLPRKSRQEILKELSKKEIHSFLHYLDLEAASEIICDLDKKRRIEVADELGEDIKDKLKVLAQNNSSHVENLMDLNYIEIDESTPMETITRVLGRYEKKTGRFPTILVVDDGKFVGSLPGHALVLNSSEKGLKAYVKELPTVHYADGAEKIIKAFKAHPNDKIVVLDDDDSILGIIYSDEVIGLIEKETARNLYEFAGLDQEEDVDDPWFKKVSYRYKWLVINLFTGFLAAYVVSSFEETISSYVLLAAYMPIVAGMGGNAATQTLAVVVRGLSLKTITAKHAIKIVRKEVLAGFVNGVINAIVIMLMAFGLSHSFQLGMVAGAAVTFNLVVAGFFGTVVPLIMKRLGKDPASSATIFITTATDVLGFMAFLGLAKWILM